ncbi:hypothetical protein [Streptomyces sp. NBC_00459]|uniref:hypothetical protein n=1 Tax=Streptomyces sp. NBC_00459 TaxID=2975749 RepID=UPI002E1813C3
MSVSAIRNSIPGVTFTYTPSTPPISAVLERQLGRDRVRFAPNDRVYLAALLHRLPRGVLRRARRADAVAFVDGGGHADASGSVMQSRWCFSARSRSRWARACNR